MEQITITLPDGTRDKLRKVGLLVKNTSPEDLLKELALIASNIPQNAGVRTFRKGIDTLLARMGCEPEKPQVVYMHSQ